MPQGANSRRSSWRASVPVPESRAMENRSTITECDRADPNEVDVLPGEPLMSQESHLDESRLHICKGAPSVRDCTESLERR